MKVRHPVTNPETVTHSARVGRFSYNELGPVTGSFPNDDTVEYYLGEVQIYTKAKR